MAVHVRAAIRRPRSFFSSSEPSSYEIGERVASTIKNPQSLSLLTSKNPMLRYELEIILLKCLIHKLQPRRRPFATLIVMPKQATPWKAVILTKWLIQGRRCSARRRADFRL